MAFAANALAQSPPAQTTSAETGRAKPATSSGVAPVVVQAPAPPNMVELQSYRFVEKNVAIGNPEIDQVTRWRGPVCVQVVGLVPNQNEQIQARIAEVAKAVDLRVGKAGCHANIEVVFTDKPQAVMDTVYNRREYMLGYNHRHLGYRLKTVARPIQAWHVTATVGGWGWGGYGVDYGPGQMTLHSEVIDDPDNHPPNGCGESPAFTSCLQGVFKNVFVVVDNKFLGDNSLGLVADYLAMVTLAQPNSLDGCNEFPSVIDLFAKAGCPDRETPEGLTPADAAFLTSLYLTDPEKKRRFAENDIANRMAKILIKANAVSK
ncbi:MAG: hypothetical protein ACXU82_13580 [Caulobacteraceae bacterium]